MLIHINIYNYERLFLIFVHLFHLDKPIINFTSSEASQHVTIGASVVLTCNTKSVPISYVTLFKNDTVGLKSGQGQLSHTITAERSSTGNYSCIAENFEGKSRADKTIIVQGTVPFNFASTF